LGNESRIAGSTPTGVGVGVGVGVGEGPGVGVGVMMVKVYIEVSFTLLISPGTARLAVLVYVVPAEAVTVPVIVTSGRVVDGAMG
jgi:hypothetical protein